MSNSLSKTITPVEQSESRKMRPILAASFIGSTIEFYDFILYATAAAIVFGEVFFHGLGPSMAIFASFGTMAAGYLARPLGGLIFGHFGDRLGRKRVLILTMLLMGGCTVLMGLIPPSATLGALAPTLLITLRIVQGLAVGGEWGGAMLIALEHSPGGKRGFAASFANMGGPAGAVLATIVVAAFSTLPHEAFISWGWRIPFLLSAVLVLVGLVIRLKVAESPLFQSLENQASKRKIPVTELFTRYKKNMLIGIVAGLPNSVTQGLMTVWAVSFVVGNGMDPTGVLLWKTAGALTTLVVVFLAARYCDRFGRKPVMLVGTIAGILAIYPILTLLQLNTLWAFGLAIVISGGLCQAIVFGPYAAFTAELFPTRIRYTGASITFQSSSTFGAGFSPAIAAFLLIQADGALWLIGVFWAVVLAAAAVAIIASREGRSLELNNID